MGIRAKIEKELAKKPRSLKELKAKLGNDKKVAHAVEELERRGKLIESGGMYALPDAKSKAGSGAGKSAAKAGARSEPLPCVLVKLTAKFGFARPAEGSDIFIPAKALAGALPGDGILVATHPSDRVLDKPEGEVVRITRPRTSFTGVIVQVDGRLALAPDACPACPIFIKKSADGGAQEGEKAAVEIIERGDSYEAHRAGVAMRFGSAQESKQCIKAMLYSAGVTKHFPAKVKAEAKKWEGAEVSARDCEGRTDFRALPVFTIDGADTKDIDDAVSIEKLPDGWRLGVHIAAVSEYVRAGSALDAEAMARGTSVYYADSVVPMLPKALSNGICSLNEGADRLTFSCLLTLGKDACVRDAKFVRGVIRSRVKGVYDEINALWDGTADTAVCEKYAAVREPLNEMHAVYEKLRALRTGRGALDIESGEAKLSFDEAGRCVAVARRARGDAERMIEEFMLLANTAAAALAKKQGIPFVYRVHEKPDLERVEMLRESLGALGVSYRFAGDIPTAKELARLLDATRGTPLARAVHENVLRSMAKAKYSPVPEGHFGLALADYAHFTSPIRRYPDLSIHRILSDVCAGADGETLKKKYTQFVAEASVKSSEREMAAMALEREADACCKAEWMRQYVGVPGDEGVFLGTVAGVMPFGIYIELENTVEGLVRAETLSRHALTLMEGVALRDVQTGRVWRLGDRLRVRAIQADVSCGRIEFEPVDAEPIAKAAPIAI